MPPIIHPCTRFEDLPLEQQEALRRFAQNNGFREPSSVGRTSAAPRPRLAEQAFGPEWAAQQQAKADQERIGGFVHYSAEVPLDPTPSPFGFPEPVPASRLRLDGDGGTEWLWRGLVARRGFTLLSALWKAGKTTLLSPLLRAFAEGGAFCGLEVKPARILYVSEENQGLWAQRRDRFGLADHVHFLFPRFLGKLTAAQWKEFVKYLEDRRRRLSADLVAIDTLSRFWPVRDENSAGDVTDALLPLQRLTEEAALLGVCHLRKGDGAEGTATRGSGALPSFANVLIELRRVNPADRRCRQRVLTAYGHYSEVPGEEIVVELAEDGLDYMVHGSRSELSQRQVGAVIAGLLPTQPPGWDWQEVKEHWPEEPGPGKARLLAALQQGVRDGAWRQEGEGKRGDPLKFWRPAAG